MGSKAKNGLFFFLFAILFLPMLQKAFPFIKSAPLSGGYQNSADVEFKPDKWFDGSYWDGKSKYLNDHLGFRPDFVRVNNQLDYSLFRKIRVGWKLLGDDSSLCQDTYIYSYLGRDFDGYPYIQEKVTKLKALQDTLARVGKSLIFVYAPSKAYYYPEHIPKKLRDTARGITNLETYKRLGDAAGVNQIDFNAWLPAMKYESKELLYPRQGFHWSVYGSLLAADSLIRYIERLRNIHMVHPVWERIEHTMQARDKDDDIAKSMNLVVPFTKETFSYPVVRFAGDKTAVKPRVIYVGDSFLFQWMRQWVMENVNSDWQIWYYNRELINRTYNEDACQPFNDEYVFEQVGKADVIVIMFTSPNLSKMSNNFVEKMYDHFYAAKPMIK